MTRARRVAVLTSEYPPHVFGGLGRHVDEVTSVLAGRLALDLYVPAQGDYRRRDRRIALHEVFTHDPRSNEDLWLQYSLAALGELERGPDYDLVHCHDWMTVLAGAAYARRAAVPLVFNVHLPQARGVSLAMENIGLACADLVVVNSRAAQEEIEARGIATGRIAVVPNGVDDRVFKPPKRSPARVGPILFVGRLVPQKGVDVLLHAFGILLHRCGHSRLAVVGDGEQELYLQRIARYLGIAHRVRFLGWRTGRALVRSYQQAAVVAMPSQYEPFGIVALEAMACGRPVVASCVGGLPDIVEDGLSGYLVPPGDPLRLAQRLATVLVEGETRRRLGRAARRRAAGFRWNRVGATMLQLYRTLAPRPAPGPAATEGDVVRSFVATVPPDIRELAERLAAAL